MPLRVNSVHRTTDPPDAAVDQDRIPLLPPGVHVHETAEKDAAEVDDGNAGHERPATSTAHVAIGAARARAAEFRDAVQTQDGGNGTGRLAPSQL